MATVSGAVSMSATTTLEVVGDSHVTTPSLLDQILGVVNQDPALIGALGYADDMYTSRLMGDIT